MSVEKPVFAIITCSDTRGPECDTAGDALESLIEEQGWACRTHMIVKDDRAGIAAAIKRCTDDLKVDIVLTCGGSGLSPRDNTPDARRVRARGSRHRRGYALPQPADHSLRDALARNLHAARQHHRYQPAGKREGRSRELGRHRRRASPCGKDDGRRRALIPLPLYCRFVSKRARTA